MPHFSIKSKDTSNKVLGDGWPASLRGLDQVARRLLRSTLEDILNPSFGKAEATARKERARWQLPTKTISPMFQSWRVLSTLVGSRHRLT